MRKEINAMRIPAALVILASVTASNATMWTPPPQRDAFLGLLVGHSWRRFIIMFFRGNLALPY